MPRDVSSPAAPGDTLRARKRAATRLAIRRAAIDLALEHGYENVTVDMICEASLVSQRTFFNYFGSKEGAFLSGAKALPPPDVVRAFIDGTGSSVFADLFTMIAGTVVDIDANLELFRARHQLIHQTPELLNQENARIGETEDAFAGFVMDRFHFHGRTEADTPDLEDEARMVVALVFGAMRFVMQKWVAGNFTETREELVRAASGLIQRITANEHWP
jgi:AcrR family transcriptional regulator